MNSVEQLFTPLGKEYCVYFYYLSVFSFIMFAFTLISGIYIGITQKESYLSHVKTLMFCLVYFITYFQDRLLYSMCVN